MRVKRHNSNALPNENCRLIQLKYHENWRARDCRDKRLASSILNPKRPAGFQVTRRLLSSDLFAPRNRREK